MSLDRRPDPWPAGFSAFHAFYDEHIYLSLLVYDQDGDLVVTERAC